MRRYGLLIATLVPVVYMFAFLGIFAAVWSGANDDLRFGPVLVAFHLGMMLWSLALLAFYIVDVFRNPVLDETLRVVWTVTLVVAHIVAMLVYWWMYMRRAAPATR